MYIVGNRGPQRFLRRGIMKEAFERVGQPGWVMTGTGTLGASGSEEQWAGWK